MPEKLLTTKAPPKKRTPPKRPSKVARAVSAVVAAVTPTPAPPSITTKDPWLRDDERRAGVNAASNGRDWIQKRPDWLER